MFPQVFQAWQRQLSHFPRRITAEMNASSAGISIDFVDSSGLSLNFEQILASFPAGSKQSSVNFSYLDFLLFDTKILSDEFLRNEIKLKTPSDLRNLQPDSAAQIYQKRKSFFVDKKLGFDEIQAFNSLINEKPDKGTIHKSTRRLQPSSCML